MRVGGKRIGAVAFAAVSIWTAATPTRAATEAVPVTSGCPNASARAGVIPYTVDEVIRVARSRVVGSVTHYQGRTEKRTRLNTPVEAVVMDIGFSTIPWARRFFQRAERRCGAVVAHHSNVVVFHEGLSVIADATIVEFVVRTDRGWSVYGA